MFSVQEKHDRPEVHARRRVLVRRGFVVVVVGGGEACTESYLEMSSMILIAEKGKSGTADASATAVQTISASTGAKFARQKLSEFHTKMETKRGQGLNAAPSHTHARTQTIAPRPQTA